MNKNMTRQPSVYGLRAGAVFGYVGMTTVNPQTRLWEHRSRARAGHTAPVYDWMRSVGVDTVEIEVLDSAMNNEGAWIVKLIADGHPLANQQGRDGVLHSNGPRMKEINSQQKKGKPTWIKGKTGEAAGWTDARRKAAAESMRERMSR